MDIGKVPFGEISKAAKLENAKFWLPDDYVVVPKEPTAKMMEAWYRAEEKHTNLNPNDFTPSWNYAYKAMIEEVQK